MSKHTLSYILNHLPVKRDEIHLYARKGGGHIHINKDCTMLSHGQFEKYKYKEVSVLEAHRRKLSPCACMMKWLLKNGVKGEEINLLGG